MNSAIAKNKRLKTALQNDWLPDAKKAEEWKIKKRKQKSEENKVKEGQMRNRLNELNGEFKKIRQSKKESKKMFTAVL